MRGLFCPECLTIRSLPRRDLEPVSCDCGNLVAWWSAGEVRYYSRRCAGLAITWEGLRSAPGTYHTVALAPGSAWASQSEYRQILERIGG